MTSRVPACQAAAPTSCLVARQLLLLSLWLRCPLLLQSSAAASHAAAAAVRMPRLVLCRGSKNLLNRRTGCCRGSCGW